MENLTVLTDKSGFDEFFGYAKNRICYNCKKCISLKEEFLPYIYSFYGNNNKKYQDAWPKIEVNVECDSIKKLFRKFIIQRSAFSSSMDIYEIIDEEYIGIIKCKNMDKKSIEEPHDIKCLCGTPLMNDEGWRDMIFTKIVIDKGKLKDVGLKINNEYVIFKDNDEYCANVNIIINKGDKITFDRNENNKDSYVTFYGYFNDEK